MHIHNIFNIDAPLFDQKTENPEDRKTEKPKNRKTEKPKSRKRGRPKNRKTGRPEDRKTEKPEDRNTEMKTNVSFIKFLCYSKEIKYVKYEYTQTRNARFFCSILHLLTLINVRFLCFLLL